MNQVKRNMNLALDHELSTMDRAELDEQLASSPGEMLFWDRMQAVDRMLHTAPSINASEDFCDRLMLKLAARSAQMASRPNYGPILGMIIAVSIGIPIALGTLLLVGRLIADPVALGNLLSALLQQLSHAITVFVEAAAAVVALAIPIALAIAGGVWFLTSRREQVTYRIPVTMA